MLGQFEYEPLDIFSYESFDIPVIPESYDFYNPNIGDVSSLYYEPSTGQYEFYNPPSGDVSGAYYSGTYSGIAAKDSSLLDVIKSVLGIAAPVITAVLTADQKATATAAQAKAAQAKATTTGTLGATLASITSNFPLLAGIGLVAYFLLRRSGNGGGGSTRRRSSPRRKR